MDGIKLAADEMTTVRSIDLGYGFVKYTNRNNVAGEPAVVTRQIPALAPMGSAQRVDLGGVGFRQPQTISVNVKEVLYQVGPDTPLLLAGQSGRSLTGDYSRSDRYHALMLGTLAYLGERMIDLLVLGLPVSKYKSERERLASFYSGIQEVPMLTEADRKTKVEVKKVVVLPQPMGGFLDAKLGHAEGANWRGSTLVIDPGFFTFDWIVVSETSTYIDSRSGAVQGGVSSILRAIADELEIETTQQISDLFPIDQALKANEPVFVWGGEYPLAQFTPIIEGKCRQYVRDMVARLGDASDIRRVVVCGGGASLFSGAIKECFPKWTVHTNREPMFANVRGFQAFGKLYMQRQRTLAAA